MVRQRTTTINERTPEQRAAGERMMREEFSKRRLQCNFMGFWRICGTRRCRRHRACTGDSPACFRKHWALMPEDHKEWWRGGIVAKAGGATSAAEIGRAADARRMEYLRSIGADEESVVNGEAAADARIRRL